MLFEPYFLIKLAHLLLFVYWLGGDIGVFYSAIQLRDRRLSLEARQLALKILGWVDQIPRYCLVLMLPVGYSLADQLGIVVLPRIVFILLWVIAVAWLWMVWAIHHLQGRRATKELLPLEKAEFKLPLQRLGHDLVRQNDKVARHPGRGGRLWIKVPVHIALGLFLGG